MYDVCAQLMVNAYAFVNEGQLSFKVSCGPCSRALQQWGFNLIEAGECWGWQESFFLFSCRHSLARKNPRTVAVIKKGQRGVGQTEVDVQGKTSCISWPLPSALCVRVSVTPSPSPSVINDQPSACVYVYEQTALLSSNVKTTSPAGFLNKYSVFYWAQFVTGHQITKACYCTSCCENS